MDTKPSTKRTIIHFTPEMHELLRRLSYETGLSMSELVRRAVAEKYGTGEGEKEK